MRLGVTKKPAEDHGESCFALRHGLLFASWVDKRG
jgi:hypothetical protein